jgi:HAD superfamily hydrolase (TIGR01509 family)
MKRLVLDAGGVLYDEGFRPLLGSLAVSAGRPAEDGVDYYNTQLRRHLWRGCISVDEFWTRLSDFLPLTKEQLAELIENGAPGIFNPLDSLEKIEEWSEKAEVWILSNHRHEWLLPALEESGIRDYFDRIIISSSAGHMKPDLAIYEGLREGEPEEVMFVDDKAENLDAAREASAADKLVLADLEGNWISEVDTWLAGK